MTVVEEYISLTTKWKVEYGEKTLVLMQVGSFFEIYALLDPEGNMTGSNIQDVASINDLAISNKSNQRDVVMAGFGTPYIEKYLKKLQEAGYTVVIYIQEMQGNTTTRKLSEIISPGTYFLHDSPEISNNITCIWIHKSNQLSFLKSQITFGISNIDIHTGKTSVSQYSNEYYHNPSTYDELERYISIYKPNECIFISNLSIEQINDIIEYTSIKCSTIHKLFTSNGLQPVNDKNDKNDKNNNKYNLENAEKQTYQRDIIKRFYPNISEETFETFTYNGIALQSLSFLLDFSYKHSPYLVSHLSEPVFENYTDKLILANHSLKQLNMVDDSRHQGRYASVYSLLNKCVTNMGKRQFLQTIHNPITKIEDLCDSYNITEHVLETSKWNFYRDNISGIKDMQKINRKLVYKKITPKDLYILVQDLFKVQSIYREIKKDDKLFIYLHKKMKNDIDIDLECNSIIQYIQSLFDIEKCIYIDDIKPESLSIMDNEKLSFILPNTSIDIDTCMNTTIDSREKWDALQHTLSGIISKTEKKSTKNADTIFIKSHETPKSAPLLVGTSRRIAILKSQLSTHENKLKINYFSHKHTKENQSFELLIDTIEYQPHGSSSKKDKDMIITNHQIKEMANHIQFSKERWVKEINLFFYNFIENFISYKNRIEHIQKYISEIDIIQCKCYIANKYNYCKPLININASKSYFSCDGLRHPLIEHLQTSELYVTNELELGDGGILLYGTNAVGKTSFIKSVGITVIMAQAGLFVPCSSFTFYPYKSIFTRILGNDNIFKGLSTFAVEMTELRTIFELSDENSLILGDELCSGTESHSALSIFTAGLEILHEKRCTFLFATHFHEITKYDEIKNLNRLKMKHMTVTYLPDKGVLVYDRKLKDGAGDSMYGLEVCKSLNLPNNFLNRAHELRMKYNPEIKSILNEKTSHFNHKKIMGLCEICSKEMSSEVHHLIHQKNASVKNNYIDTFHKNHQANLISICEQCHRSFHNNENKQYKIKKTLDGEKILVSL